MKSIYREVSLFVLFVVIIAGYVRAAVSVEPVKQDLHVDANIENPRDGEHVVEVLGELESNLSYLNREELLTLIKDLKSLVVMSFDLEPGMHECCGQEEERMNQFIANGLIVGDLLQQVDAGCGDRDLLDHHMRIELVDVIRSIVYFYYRSQLGFIHRMVHHLVPCCERCACCRVVPLHIRCRDRSCVKGSIHGCMNIVRNICPRFACFLCACSYAESALPLPLSSVLGRRVTDIYNTAVLAVYGVGCCGALLNSCGMCISDLESAYYLEILEKLERKIQDASRTRTSSSSAMPATVRVQSHWVGGRRRRQKFGAKKVKRRKR